MLRSPYSPLHSQNRMRHEGDTTRAREFYFHSAPHNLKLLVQGRYQWMNAFINGDDRGLEVGCGTGISREFIHCKEFQLSDVGDFSWLDHKHVDALKTPFDDEQFDFVVSSNMVHHLAHPLQFFREMQRILRPRGRLIIQEINGSTLMRVLLHLMRHEGYSYEVNVFDESCVCNDPADPWSANCVIPNLLWDDPKEFERHVPAFKIIHHRFRECTTLLNSGGVIAKTRCIPLPHWLVRLMQSFDTALATLFPHAFALQRQIVLEKQSPATPINYQHHAAAVTMGPKLSAVRPKQLPASRAA